MREGTCRRGVHLMMESVLVKLFRFVKLIVLFSIANPANNIISNYGSCSGFGLT